MIGDELKEEIKRLGHLKSSGQVIYDYALRLTENSKSSFEKSGSGEWIMSPDNWIGLKLTYRRWSTFMYPWASFTGVGTASLGGLKFETSFKKLQIAKKKIKL